MQTNAVRLYGKQDLRLDTFDLPALGEDEIRARIVSDSICMSTYKAAKQGSDHKRVPNDIAEDPVIVGHEFCGEILEVGPKWKERFEEGQKFAIQPALNYKGSLDAPGYSYRQIGGSATVINIPNEVMEMECLLDYKGEGYYMGSLAEPMSCIVGAFHANYHTTAGSYEHKMGVVPGGSLAILAGAGPMGLGALDYAVNGPVQPKLVVITDIDQTRLDRAASIYSVEMAAAKGVELKYVNTGVMEDAVAGLKSLTPEGVGYDDVFVFAPVAPVVEQGDAILNRDGCLNFFAGPTDTSFSAKFNFYNVHYAATHIVGTSGGNTDDMRESLELMSAGKINPSSMITHIGGLGAVVDTTLNLPSIPGGKKLIYTHADIPLVGLEELESKKDENALFGELAEVVAANNGLWSVEAEKLLLSKAG